MLMGQGYGQRQLTRNPVDTLNDRSLIFTPVKVIRKAGKVLLMTAALRKRHYQ